MEEFPNLGSTSWQKHDYFLEGRFALGCQISSDSNFKAHDFY